MDQLDKVTAVTYDAGGNQLTVRDPNNVGADMVYDALGRNTQRTDTFGDITKTDYDRSGNAVKQTDAKNKFTLISFDSRNRRKSTTDRITASTNFAYTALGQLLSLTDAENQTTAYTYDARGSKLTEQYPDHVTNSTVGQPGYGIVTFVYDNAGRVSRKQDQAGDTCSYNYDLAGRMTSRNYRWRANSPTGPIADTDTFTFDRAGRMLTAVSGRYTNTVAYAYDPAGRKATEGLTISGQTYTIGSSYNARNELVSYTYPDGSVADRAYTARGALSQLKLDTATVDTRTYDDGGRMLTSVLGNGITETRAYRTDNLLTSINSSNTNLGNLAYTWDANKNKTAETITGVMSNYGFTAAGTTYDFEDRLTGFQRAATSGPSLLSQSWSLSTVGDWNSVTTNGTAQTRTHGPTHELLTAGGQGVTTDVKGNVTRLPGALTYNSKALSMRWDFDNRMIGGVYKNLIFAEDETELFEYFDVENRYDALGRRVARKIIHSEDLLDNEPQILSSEETIFVPVDQQTIADYVGGASPATPTYRYVYASYIDEPVVRKGAGTSGTVHYYHRNQQYSIYAITDAAANIAERYAYTAYGQPTILDAAATVIATSAISNRYTYTAREWDATVGLYHFRARWMSGLTGRFLTRDPIGFEGSPWSVYQYVFDNPLYWVDPNGKQAAIPPSDKAGCLKKCGNDKSCGFKCVSCAKSLDDWFDRQKKKKDSGELDKVLGGLTNCPCSIPKDPWKVPDKWYWDGACNPTRYLYPDLGWHPGAKGCIRSVAAGPYETKPVQQCCYDGSGKLITSGSGAGTPDVNDPGHQEDEVIPFDCAHHLDGDKSGDWKNQGPHVQAFIGYRPPNNGNNCKANDPNSPPAKAAVK